MRNALCGWRLHSCFIREPEGRNPPRSSSSLAFILYTIPKSAAMARLRTRGRRRLRYATLTVIAPWSDCQRPSATSASRRRSNACRRNGPARTGGHQCCDIRPRTGDGPARRVTVLGAITAGLGLFLDSLTIFNADARMFRRMATGADGSYFYFCVCCRVPTMCMLVSATCLAAFLLIVAWGEWRGAVIVLSLVAGIAMSLQFLGSVSISLVDS
ncbi:hypothetical protein C8Q72DRAFT_378126 [Fomitopsis betulina]|nr:hypothetical protein C8Q72DRAFT_378126 [Fomitopsis betulina]